MWQHILFVTSVSALIPDVVAAEPHGRSSPDEEILPPPRLFLGAPSPLQETNTKEQ